MKYLVLDCSHAAYLLKRPKFANVDLPAGKDVAKIEAITLPQQTTFEEPIVNGDHTDLEIDQEVLRSKFTMRESVRLSDDVVMQEIRQWSDLSSVGSRNGHTFREADKSALDQFDVPLTDDGFGGTIGVGLLGEDDLPPVQDEQVIDEVIDEGRVGETTVDDIRKNLQRLDLVLSPVTSLEKKSRKKKKKKRGILVDDEVVIAGEEMKAWIIDSHSLVRQKELGPETKEKMRMAREGKFEYIMNNPLRYYCRTLRDRFVRNAISEAVDDEEDTESTVHQNGKEISIEDLQLPQLDDEIIDEHRSPILTTRIEKEEVRNGSLEGSFLETKRPSRRPRTFDDDSIPKKRAKKSTLLGEEDIETFVEYQNGVDDISSKGEFTEEEINESRRRKRTNILLHYLDNIFSEEGGTIRFSEIVANNRKMQVAQKFSSLLILYKQQIIDLKQRRAFGEIYISQGKFYDSTFSF